MVTTRKWDSINIIEELNSGKTRSQIARENGVSRQAICAWVKKYYDRKTIFVEKKTIPSSSTVEQLAVNQEVVGSNPA